MKHTTAGFTEKILIGTMQNVKTLQNVKTYVEYCPVISSY